MLTVLQRISRLSPVVACACMAAIAGCDDGAVSSAGPYTPRFEAGAQTGPQDLERRNCDTVVTIAVNDWVLSLAPGHVPPAASLLAGQTFFQGNQVIFGGGALYGTSAADVVVGYDVNGVFPTSIASGPICVLQTQPVHHTIATLSLAAGAAAPAGLLVKQESFAYPNPPDNGYVLLRYAFTNAGNTPIAPFYSGWLADWDILIDGDPFTDAVRYDNGLGLGEATESDTISFPQILGIVPMGPSGSFSFVGWENAGLNPPTFGGYFDFLAGGVNLSLPIGPTDIREMMGLAPLTLAPGQTTVAYFAIVGGATRAAFESNVAAARAKAVRLGFCGLDNQSHAPFGPQGPNACES